MLVENDKVLSIYKIDWYEDNSTRIKMYEARIEWIKGVAGLNQYE